jgi:DNA-directed RNA polymerase subunit RPC12/RpoP
MLFEANDAGDSRHGAVGLEGQVSRRITKSKAVTKPSSVRKRARRFRLCDACGVENTAEAQTCKACGSKRFAKEWVRALRRVNKNFAVEVAEPHPSSSRKDLRLTLYKWWPGGHANFNINGPAQWQAVRNAVDELAPYLGWSTHAELVDALRAREKDDKALDSRLRRAAAADPELLARVVKGVDFKRVSEEDIPEVVRQLATIADVLAGADRGMRLAIEQVVKKLPSQGKTATEGLADLMEQLTLRQITAVTLEVQRRAELLKLFKNRMLDDRTYEIRGENSIHRLLETAMWIVDERYWLMQSNATVRTLIGRQLAKEDKRFEKQRPDFVCGTVDRGLFIIEIKRPAHTLQVEDLNQLERYVYLAEKYSDVSRLEAAILVGNRKSTELSGRTKYRSSSFRVRTYSDLVQDTERRYEAYLTALNRPSASLPGFQGGT